MFHETSASVQNISEYASDTIAYTVMSQKSMPLGFLSPLNRPHCSSAPGLRTHSDIPGVFRKDWETGMRSTRCLFWHFILTYLCLYICICKHTCSFFLAFPAIAVLSHMVVCQHIPTLAPGEEQPILSLVVNERAETITLEVQRWRRRATLLQKKLSEVCRQHV
jgi:hypothetical protein